MIIYQAYNPISNKYYVGKTVSPLHKRRLRHEKDAYRNCGNSMFHKAIRKYGLSVFEWCVLHHAKAIDELNSAEKHWIDILKRAGHVLYNLRPGGDGGSYPGEGNPNFGKTVPDSRKKKISEGLRLHYKDNPGTMTGKSGLNCPWFGKRHTDESKAKISAAHKSIPKPHLSGSRNPSATAVVCLTTGEMFGTATEAAKKFQCDLSSIIKCCKGKKKMVAGLKFEYVNTQ
jgi:group I intron endonuclease